MANCDFGSPCDCSDCRSTTYTNTCPKCGKTARREASAKMTFVTDRKGASYYEKETIEDTREYCEKC